MGANFGRVKTWVKERLTFAALNAEFNNILNNFTPSGMDDYSSTVSEMRTITDPAPYSGGVQVESAPTSLAGELARIRYVLKRLAGGTYWYSDPARILNAHSADLAMLLAFDGSTQNEVLSDFIARGGIINALSLSSADVAAADFDAANKKFGNYGYSLGAGNILAFPGKVLRTGLLSAHFRNLSAGDYIAYNPLLGIEVYLTSLGYLSVKLTRKTAAVEGAKDTSSVTGTNSRAGSTSWQHVAMRFVIDNANGASGDSLELKRDGADENTGVGSANLLANVGDGGVWFFGAKRNDPAWDKFSSMNDTPDAELTSPWTASLGSGGTGGVSNGVLTIAAGGVAEAVYSKTNNIDLSHMTIDVKAKLNASGGSAILIDVYDHSMTRGVLVTLGHDRVSISAGLGIGGSFFLNGFDFNTFRVTSSGSPNPTLNFYINGVLVFTATLNVATTLSADYIKFGSAISSSADFEYVGYAGSLGSVYAPVAVSTSGQLDDIALAKVAAVDAVITQLQNNSARSVFGADPKYGLTLPMGSNLAVKAYTGSGEVTGSALYFPSDGRTPVDFDCAYRLETTTAALLYAQVDSSGDIVDTADFSSSGYGAQAQPFQARRVYKLGLRKISLQFVISSGTTTIYNGHVRLSGGK